MLFSPKAVILIFLAASVSAIPQRGPGGGGPGGGGPGGPGGGGPGGDHGGPGGGGWGGGGHTSPCVMKCLDFSLNEGHCRSVFDRQCVCFAPDYRQAVRRCVSSFCDRRDWDDARQVFEDQCGHGQWGGTWDGPWGHGGKGFTPAVEDKKPEA